MSPTKFGSSTPLSVRPASSATQNISQQFTVAQKQTEAIKRILPRRPAAASTQSSAAAPPSAPFPSSIAPLRPLPPLLSLSSSLHLGGSLGIPSLSRTPPNQAASIRVSGSETGDLEVGGSALWEMVSASLPAQEEGRMENFLFPFVFVPPLATLLFYWKCGTLDSIYYISGSQEGAVGIGWSLTPSAPPWNQAMWRQSFTAPTSLCPRKVVGYGQSWTCGPWTGLCTSSRSRC